MTYFVDVDVDVDVDIYLMFLFDFDVDVLSGVRLNDNPAFTTIILGNKLVLITD
jgi:hypothetical protein